MKPILIMTGVEILEKDLVLPQIINREEIPIPIQGALSMTLSIYVQGNGDLSKYIKKRKLNEEKILSHILEGKLKIKTMNKL